MDQHLGSHSPLQIQLEALPPLIAIRLARVTCPAYDTTLVYFAPMPIPDFDPGRNILRFDLSAMLAGPYRKASPDAP
ncbi:hypothetical protein [Mesorhizobium helmanticense]|uniref:Uncharacterized protein n=1 Tax=Mesorhizobium helmanticense TaxID=1776423 RepID=A0A2T4IX07_9HYPH|nr:hypothetical protein [Mesorhizobium helmanticense]PTE10113.1 hypothetical protein C9427_13450 [Mesorhizobium helmanticense]